MIKMRAHKNHVVGKASVRSLLHGLKFPAGLIRSIEKKTLAEFILGLVLFLASKVYILGPHVTQLHSWPFTKNVSIQNI